MKFTNKILLTGTLLAGAGAFALQTPGASAGQANQVPQSPSTASPSSQTPSSQYPSSQSPSSQQPGMQPGAAGTAGSAQGGAQPEQAPPPQPGRPSIDDQVRMLSQELNLTSDQQTKLKTILEDQHQQAMTFVNDNTMSRDDKIQKIRVLRESTITKARGIMNDDQKKKLDAMLQQQQQGAPHGQQGPSGQQSPSSQSPAGQPPASRPPQ
jgi:hypothetical protein